MAIPKKSALIISSNVNGLDPLKGVYQNAGGASKVLMKLEILPDCSYGGELSFSEIMQKIEKFFGKESEVHILWGIFHGAVASIESCGVKKHIGCWVLSNNEHVSLSRILQKWDDARARGTAHHLLIISDAWYSGHMVTEAAKLGLRDVSVQASCHPSFTSLDTEGQSFSDLLVMILEQHHRLPMSRNDHLQDPADLAEGILNRHQPRFYRAADARPLDWSFVGESSSSDDSSGYSSDRATATLAANDEESLLIENQAPPQRRGRLLSIMIALCSLVPLAAAQERNNNMNINMEMVPPVKFVEKKCFNYRVPLRHKGFESKSMWIWDQQIANPSAARVSAGLYPVVLSEWTGPSTMTWKEWADCALVKVLYSKLGSFFCGESPLIPQPV